MECNVFPFDTQGSYNNPNLNPNPKSWLTSSPTPCGQSLFSLLTSEAYLILRMFHRGALVTVGRERYFCPSRAVLQSVGWKAVISPVYVCEWQAASHRGDDLKIGGKLLVTAVLEVPLAQFSICSRRVKTQWGQMGVECRLTESGGIYWEALMTGVIIYHSPIALPSSPVFVHTYIFHVSARLFFLVSIC